MKLANTDIRTAAKEQGVYLWQVASEYGCNDSNFSRKLRRELPEKEKNRIFAIIDELAAAKQKEA